MKSVKKLSNLQGKKILLRKLKLSDAKDIYENVKDKAVVRWAVSIPHPYPKDGAISYIKSTHYKIKTKKGYAFAIVPLKEARSGGIIALMNVDWKNKNAEIGYWLGKKYWGKGYTTEAVKLMTKFAFQKLNLHRLHAKLFAENIQSRRVLEKAGYRLEGSMKEERFRFGRWHDGLRFGIVNK
jgi:RimJ/RimL family protein N-acetyltransferase